MSESLIKDKAGVEAAISTQKASLEKWEADPSTAPNILNMIYVCATIEDDYDVAKSELETTTDPEQRELLQRVCNWNIEAAGRVQKLAKTLGFESLAEHPPLKAELEALKPAVVGTAIPTS